MTGNEDTVIGSVEVSNIPLFLADIAVSTLFLVALCKWLGRVFMVSWTGAHSLVYYFFCGASPTFVALLLNKIGFSYSSYWQMLIALILVYDLCTIIAYIIYRYLPFLIGKQKEIAITATFFLMVMFSENVSAQEQPSLATLRSLSMPVVVINTIDNEEPTGEYVVAPEGCNGGSIRNATKVPGSLVIYKGDETLYDSGEYEEGVSGMKYNIRGNWSSWLPKKPFKIKLEKKADLLCRGNKKYNDRNWVLLKEEHTLLNLYAGTEINRLAGMPWTPAFQFVNVVINGDFRGLYALCESVRRNSDCRLDVNKDTGYIFEYDPYWWNENVWFETLMTMTNDAKFTFKYPNADGIQPAQIDYIRDYVNAFDDGLVNKNHFAEYIDTVSFASWLLAQDILGNYDAHGSNVYMTKYDDTPNSKLMMGCLWDFDAIMMTPDAWSNSHRLTYFARLISNSTDRSFANAYRQRWEEIKDTLFIK